MDDKEVEMLARHLGHDVATHKGWYRLAHSTLELSKVIRGNFDFKKYTNRYRVAL